MNFEHIKIEQNKEKLFSKEGLLRMFERQGDLALKDSYLETLNIAENIKQKGGQAFLVGGSVRDLFFNKLPKDFDLEVYGLEALKVKELFEKYKISEAGANFGVLKASLGNGFDIDISLPRKDNKTGMGHKGFSIETDPYLSFEEALKRRDFTINAMLLDPLTGEIVDPYCGKEDIRNKTLRIVDKDTFKEDPLRVLRGVQFLGRFGLKAEEESFKIFQEMIPSLKELPKERITEEWKKLLLKAEKPSFGLSLAMDLGVFDELYPDFVKLKETAQDKKWHSEGDVWVHTLMVVDEISKILRENKLNEEEELILLFSALCHDLGKSDTTKDLGYKITARGHEKAGVPKTENFLKGIDLNSKTKKKIVKLVEYHMIPNKWCKNKAKGQEITDGAFRKLARNIFPANMQELALLALADKNGRVPTEETVSGAEAYEWFIQRAKKMNIFNNIPKDIITGKDLLESKFEPGEVYTKIINICNELRDKKAYTREEILEIIKNSQNSKECLVLLKKELGN